MRHLMGISSHCQDAGTKIAIRGTAVRSDYANVPPTAIYQRGSRNVNAPSSMCPKGHRERQHGGRHPDEMDVGL